MDERLLGLSDDDYSSLAPRARVVRLALCRDERDCLTLTLVLRDAQSAEMRQVVFDGVSDLRFREPDTTLLNSVHLLVADISRHGWYRTRYRVTEVEEELVAFYCEGFDVTSLPDARRPGAADARQVVRVFSALQRTLVEAFLAQYQPVDRDFFRGVVPGLFFVDGHEWKQQRHGAGVRFTHVQLGHVDAHAHLATRPGAIDAWRLLQYLESIDVDRVELDGSIYAVEHNALGRLLDALVADQTLRRIEGPRGAGWTLEVG